MTFYQKLDAIVQKQNSLVCVGLDSDASKITGSQFSFNKAIIDATHDLVCAYKPNSAFYEARGTEGIAELKKTCDYIREKFSDIVLILDAKRADIGSSNTGYVTFAFDWLGVDGITLHPYLGKEALQPFLDRKEKGSIILCRTSNPGAGEFQDAMYKTIADHVAREWNSNNNCALVVGATYPDELSIVRRIVGDMPILVPGIGTQGGGIEATLKAGLNSKRAGLIINSSRGIIFPSEGANFENRSREEALKLRDSINAFR